jgi:hypothetical protein
MASVYEFELRGANFYAIKEQRVIWVPIAPICDEITIDPEGQRQRINRDEILRDGACIMQVPFLFPGGGPQRINCLQLRLLHYWLLGVETGHIKDEAKRKAVLAFKREAADVLFAYFMPDYAKIMGVKLPTFQARLVHGDLFDREVSAQQMTNEAIDKASEVVQQLHFDFTARVASLDVRQIQTEKRVDGIDVRLHEVEKIVKPPKPIEPAAPHPGDWRTWKPRRPK